MSDYRHPVRSRPVADAPVQALLARAEDLARRWAIALILMRPLEAIAEIPLEDLAREGPGLCAQAVRALASDTDLELLLGSAQSQGDEQDRLPARAGAGRLGALAGAQNPAAVLRAVEALRGVLWDALMDELRDPAPRLVADLSDRLAGICAAIGAGLIGGATAPSDAPLDSEEYRPVEAPPFDPEGESRPAEGGPFVGQPSIEIRDVRGEGPTAWIGSIGRRLERHENDGLPFAVLLVEVVDIDRLRHSESPERLDELIGKVESALSQELRPADVLSRESDGRYWLVTPETDGVGVRMLAERLARGVRSSAIDRGAPLEVAIGIAVCPDDGQDAATLAAHADAGVYAARAAGRPIAPGDTPA